MLFAMNAVARASAVPASGPQLDNRRVIAAILDLLVVLAGVFAIGFAAGLSGTAAPGLALSAVMTAWALYYYFACESGGGQTLGKKLMRIRVVGVDGAPASLGAIAVRTLLRLIDGLFLYLVGLIVMLATGERRGRLGDLAAGTMIVSADAHPPAAAPATVVTPVVAAPASHAVAEVPKMHPFAEPTPAEPAAPAAEPEDDPVVVNSVETVSAIDLVMGEGDPT
jgi:uncharacterized RDD family membrane protein YckC